MEAAEIGWRSVVGTLCSMTKLEDMLVAKDEVDAVLRGAVTWSTVIAIFMVLLRWWNK